MVVWKLWSPVAVPQAKHGFWCPHGQVVQSCLCHTYVGDRSRLHHRVANEECTALDQGWWPVSVPLGAASRTYLEPLQNRATQGTWDDILMCGGMGPPQPGYHYRPWSSGTPVNHHTTRGGEPHSVQHSCQSTVLAELTIQGQELLRYAVRQQCLKSLWQATSSTPDLPRDHLSSNFIVSILHGS